MTDAGVAAVAERCAALQAVDVGECGQLTAAALHALFHRCPNLQYIRVGYAGPCWSP